MLSDIEHVLHAPDTYIGAVEEDKVKGWILNSDEKWNTKITIGLLDYINVLMKV